MSRKFWTMIDGGQIEISKMDLGHLANTIRMLGEALERAQSAGDKARADKVEADLQALQEEFDSRGEEIERAQKIAAVLFKGARHGKA